MKRSLLFLLPFITLTIASKAQDFAYGTFTQDEINMKQYDKDTSAHAVYLKEFGRAKIDGTNDDNIRLVTYYHAKIKIFDNKGFDHGNIEIPISNNGDVEETLEDVKAITTYTDENGMIKTAEFDKSKIYKEKREKYFSVLKFAMPAIRKGCIIEYAYTTYSPFIRTLHTWLFQDDIPKISSEYDVHIPGFWTYNASKRGALKLTENKAEVETDCFEFYGAKSDCSHLTFGMTDIPAFVEEADMTSPRNFLSAIYFELIEWKDRETGAKHQVATEWTNVDYSMKHEDDFGSQLKKQDFFKDKITLVINGKADSLERAKAIYEYVKRNIKWNGEYYFGSENGIKKTFENHIGNVGDINLSLITALKAGGINAEPVLLSTRDHGLINKLYPVISEFDYVIAKVDVGGKSYLLDATEPLLTFGMLPLRCLNDQGRVMSLDKPSYWIDINTFQRENNTYTVDLTLQPDGKLKGTVTHYCLGYAAYLKRRAIKKFNSIDEYVESLDEKSSKYKITGSKISALDSLDAPLTEKFDVEIKEYNGLNHDRLGFNPFIMGRMTENPFKLAERTYPVDWGMPSSTRFSITVHIPDNYTIENMPQDAAVKLSNNGGQFLTAFQNNGNSLTFEYVTQINKSVYSSGEYPYLKELFNRIILSEKSEIVLKKKI